MYASSSIKGTQIAMHIVEGTKELGKIEEVMMWLRLRCNSMSQVEGSVFRLIQGIITLADR
jgi:hypothetical protein